MGKLLALDGQPVAPPKPDSRQVSHLVEDRSARFLLAGVDETGKRFWFIRIRTTGFYERRFGPFQRRSDAIKSYDYLLENVLQALCDVSNRVRGFAHELVQLPPFAPVHSALVKHASTLLAFGSAVPPPPVLEPVDIPFPIMQANNAEMEWPG
jgi:hypothetical protein